jgi:RsiW-degrading membrane proteinase PrsW (M82 family)
VSPLAPGDALTVAAVVLVSFLPPLLFAVLLRNAEERRREPWKSVLRAFGWGATGATGLALAIQLPLFGAPTQFHVASFFGLVVVAPIVEELAKAWGLRWVRDDDPEPEDGFIYGGAAGLGFAATENVIYILGALLVGGLHAGAATALYRTVATVSLHAAASAWVGYGLWQARRTGMRGVFLPFLLGGIALHALYNALASVQVAAATLLAVALALLALRRVFKRVRALDAL